MLKVGDKIFDKQHIQAGEDIRPAWDSLLRVWEIQRNQMMVTVAACQNSTPFIKDDQVMKCLNLKK